MALVLAAACGGGARESAASSPRGKVPVSLDLQAVDGGDIQLSSLRGKVVVLHLFATWIPAADLDVDKLAEIHRRYPKRVQVIGVAFDPDGSKVVAPWRDAVQAPYLITLAPEALVQGRTALGHFRQLPTTVILDRRGREVARIEHPLREGELDKVIPRFLPSAAGR